MELARGTGRRPSRSNPVVIGSYLFLSGCAQAGGRKDARHAHTVSFGTARRCATLYQD
jgi:hypothetical protein